MTSRRWFHLLLGAVFIPLLSLPLVWGVAIYWLRRVVDVEARRWARRIFALAVIDTLIIVVAGGVLVAAAMGSIEAQPTAVQDRVAIGVMPDPSFSGVGVRVQHLVPGSPAAAAGLAAGDIIVRVAGKEISGPEALRSVVGEQRPGVPVSMEVTRGPSTSALDITPQWSSRIPRETAGIFEPMERHGACFPPVSAPGLLRWAIILAAIAAVAALVARRGSVSGSARGVWWTALSLASAGVASYAVPAGACVFLGGPTAAGQIFALWASSLALAGTALVARRFVGEGPASAPTRTWGSAVAMGSWYLITGALRLAVLLWAAMQLAGGRVTSSNPVESLAQGLTTMQGPGLLLLAIPGILFAPVGEELAFRGLFPARVGRLAETCRRCRSDVADLRVDALVLRPQVAARRVRGRRPGLGADRERGPPRADRAARSRERCRFPAALPAGDAAWMIAGRNDPPRALLIAAAPGARGNHRDEIASP